MNILILSHERSLNKTEALLKTFVNEETILVVEKFPPKGTKQYINLSKQQHEIVNFDLLEIVKRVPKCDKIFASSENLLGVQAQLESYYGIQNLTPFAARVVSNKQMFDDYCRSIGLGQYIPNSKTVTFHKQLDQFGDKPIFTKPDIGTGGISIMQTDEADSFNIEYRSWRNKHHLLQYLKDSKFSNKFFDNNKSGISLPRYNHEPCRIMVQEYHETKGPALAPCGMIKDGKLHVLFWLKCNKTNLNKHVQRDDAVWIVDGADVNPVHAREIELFMNKLIVGLGIQELFFAGPDFHITDNGLKAIDFNPRLGQFTNVLNKLNKNQFLYDSYFNKKPKIEHTVLWGCAKLKAGTIKSIDTVQLKAIEQYFNNENTQLAPGVQIPSYPSLQNRRFNFNLNISGSNEKDLLQKYNEVNTLLQDCITLE